MSFIINNISKQLHVPHHAVTHCAVVVESLPNLPPLNLDTVLFVGPERRSLGQVFDVMGSVTQPHYVVRFNSPEHVAESGVKVGEEVFFAPSSEEHTHYVLLQDLMTRWVALRWMLFRLD